MMGSITRQVMRRKLPVLRAVVWTARGSDYGWEGSPGVGGLKIERYRRNDVSKLKQ
mgnify:CR=1 FL=1